jgi:hypothetical protein
MSISGVPKNRPFLTQLVRLEKRMSFSESGQTRRFKQDQPSARPIKGTLKWTPNAAGELNLFAGTGSAR